MRTTLRVDVIRDRGSLGREVAGGLIENVYRFNIMNASEQPLKLMIKAEGLPGMQVLVSSQDGGNSIEIPAAANRMLPITVRAPADAAKPGSHPISFVATSMNTDGTIATQVNEKSSFIIPN